MARFSYVVADTTGSPLAPVHSYLTARGYQFPSYEEWSKSPTAPRVDSPEVQRVLRLKPGEWGTEKFRRDTYERARQFAVENTGASAPVPPKGTVYGPPSQQSVEEYRTQQAAARQSRMAQQNEAKRRLMAQQQAARDAAFQRYQSAAERSAVNSLKQAQAEAATLGKQAPVVTTKYKGYGSFDEKGNFVGQEVKWGGGPGDKRLTPSGIDVGGDLTSESRVPTGDFDRRTRNIQMFGRPPEGRITRTDTQFAAQTATPIYKPGDQMSIWIQRQWGQDKIREIQSKMARAGAMDPASGSRRGVWGPGEAAGAEAIMGFANLRGWTFERALDALVMDSDARQQAGLDGSGGSGSGSSAPLTVTDTSYSLSSLDQARQALAAVMAAQIGRKPTDAEVRKFLGQLNAKERKAPVTTTTTRTPSGAYQTTLQKDRSIDPTEEATRFTQAQKPGEVEAYGEVSYYDILASVIGGD
jgi:hypothetical protein